MENPKASGFHQEQMETMEDSTEISGKIRIRKEEHPRIGFVSNLIYLLDVFHPKFSKVEDKRKILITSLSYNTKIQNPKSLF